MCYDVDTQMQRIQNRVKLTMKSSGSGKKVELTAVQRALTELEAGTPDRVPPLKAQVLAELPHIKKLLTAGHSYEKIAAALAAEGVAIKASTLRQYVGQAGRDGGPKTQTATPATQTESSAFKQQNIDVRPTKGLEPSSDRATFKPPRPGSTEI